MAHANGSNYLGQIDWDIWFCLQLPGDGLEKKDLNSRQYVFGFVCRAVIPTGNGRVFLLWFRHDFLMYNCFEERLSRPRSVLDIQF